MSKPDDLSMETDDVLRVERDVLRREHRELDEKIKDVSAQISTDRIMLQRLKKRKLALKDRIAVITDRLTPDIIA